VPTVPHTRSAPAHAGDTVGHHPLASDGAPSAPAHRGYRSAPAGSKVPAYGLSRHTGRQAPDRWCPGHSPACRGDSSPAPAGGNTRSGFPAHGETGAAGAGPVLTPARPRMGAPLAAAPAPVPGAPERPAGEMPGRPVRRPGRGPAAGHTAGDVNGQPDLTDAGVAVDAGHRPVGQKRPHPLAGLWLGRLPTAHQSRRAGFPNSQGIKGLGIGKAWLGGFGPGGESPSSRQLTTWLSSLGGSRPSDCLLSAPPTAIVARLALARVRVSAPASEALWAQRESPAACRLDSASGAG